MCGIFGWAVGKNFNVSDPNLLINRLGKSLEHRGPDDKGFAIFNSENRLWNNSVTFNSFHPRLLLGQTRLSIIDLSYAGHQPMFSRDGKYAIVLNGEIYNYKELKEFLLEKGYLFDSNSDTEVLLYGYDFWGKQVINMLIGMFSFAIFDRNTNRLFCARDCFGIKPFYYSLSNGFCFASEINSILCFPGVRRKINNSRAFQYLSYGLTDYGDKTLFEDVFSLPPSHYIEIDVSNCEVTNIFRYWKPNLSKKKKINFSDAAEETKRIFLKNIKLHLRSDVPVGIALSGGIDSSSIASVVHLIEPDYPIHTFSYISSDIASSEEKWIDHINNHIQGISHKIPIHFDDFVSHFDDLIISQGEPFISTSILAQRCVFNLAKSNNIPVILDGQGADELFAGYDGYPSQRMMTLISNFQIYSALMFFYRATRWPGRSQKEIIHQLIKSCLPISVINHFFSQNYVASKLINRDFLTSSISDFSSDYDPKIFVGKDFVRRSLAYQLTWNGLQALLRYEDRNSMHFSIESRLPFLTKEMAEFALSLPEDYLINKNGRSKSVLIEAMKDIVPFEILHRRDKIGFITPEAKILLQNKNLISEVLHDTYSQNILNIQAVQNEWKDFTMDRIPYSSHIWRSINFLRWYKLFSVEF